MEVTKKSFFEKAGDFVKKYAWALAIGAGVLALAFLFLPILKYEVREAVYDIATDSRISKADYVYGANIIWFFTSGHGSAYTMYITIGFIVVACIFILLKKYNKDFLTIAGILFLLAVCMFLLSKEFFLNDEDSIMNATKIVGAEYDGETQYFYASVHDVFLSWGSNLGIFFCAEAFAFTTLSNQSATTKQIAEEGVLLAMAFVLNLIKIPVGATGGSINFQMLPLMIIALRHGPAHGFIAGGIVYGLITCLTDGYGFACYPFDYLIGFGSVAVMGLFRKQIFGENQEGYNLKGLIFIFVAGVIAARFWHTEVFDVFVLLMSLGCAYEVVKQNKCLKGREKCF